jgi:hypothetical protein
MALTDMEIGRAKTKGKACSIGHGAGGLHIVVTAVGGKLWRWNPALSATGDYSVALVKSDLRNLGTLLLSQPAPIPTRFTGVGLVRYAFEHEST